MGCCLLQGSATIFINGILREMRHTSNGFRSDNSHHQGLNCWVWWLELVVCHVSKHCCKFCKSILCHLHWHIQIRPIPWVLCYLLTWNSITIHQSMAADTDIVRPLIADVNAVETSVNLWPLWELSLILLCFFTVLSCCFWLRLASSSREACFLNNRAWKGKKTIPLILVQQCPPFLWLSI